MMIAAMIVVKMRDDDVFDIAMINPQQLQSVARITNQFAFSRYFTLIGTSSNLDLHRSSETPL